MKNVLVFGKKPVHQEGLLVLYYSNVNSMLTTFTFTSFGYHFIKIVIEGRLYCQITISL
jgi:hypothetical protein